ncbi:MAG: helix-turn-helix transcriptional regulator, partial [Clostridia bacterium]|nr:helix-turn-helix transcriptional regulator [Clostridia bacterium]
IYEILCLEEGSPSFWVEGAVYEMMPGDIVIARQDEMHRIIHKGSYPYRRIVINARSDFFKKQGCEGYTEVFENRPVGVGNHFSAKILKERGIDEIITRLKRYGGAGEELLVKGTITELFYALSSLPERERTKSDGLIKDIVIYINDNITSPLTLDSIAEHFYISKYYLCRLFKKKLGLTVSKYITHKRILLVKELYASGKNITEAVVNSGFGDYSSFFTAYKKETGESPRKGLTKEPKDFFEEEGHPQILSPR